MPLDGSEEKAFEDWYITMLKDWNALDPVSQRKKEIEIMQYFLFKNKKSFYRPSRMGKYDLE